MCGGLHPDIGDSAWVPQRLCALIPLPQGGLMDVLQAELFLSAPGISFYQHPHSPTASTHICSLISFLSWVINFYVIIKFCFR